jgi:hypothetical protein
MDFGFILFCILLCGLVYYLVVIETCIKNSKKEHNTIEDLPKQNVDKFKPINVVFRTIPESNEYVFKHKKLTKRQGPEYKKYPHSSKRMYFCLNKILRHFFLSEDSSKAEPLVLNYIPDDFDFKEYTNQNKSLYNTNEALPNNIASVMYDIDQMLQSDKKSDEQITYKSNKVTLKTKDDCYLNIKYTIFPKQEYDVCAVNDNIVESVLKLRRIPFKKKHAFYLKFPNDHYLSINKQGLLYSSTDKTRLFLFEMVHV